MNLWIPFFLARHNFAIFLLLFTAASCSKKRISISAYHTPVKHSAAFQGVQGKVVFREGEFTPDGQPGSNAKAYGVKRTVYVYELTDLRAVELDGGDFLANIFTEMSDSVQTDEYGAFQIAMAPGKYSLFVKENERLYSKVDENGFYWPVEVKKDSTSRVVLEVEYKAKF